MIVKRILPLLLALSLLAGCNTTPDTPEDNTPDDPTPPVVEVTPDVQDDGSLLYRTTGLASGTPAFTLAGKTYDMEFYLYWASYIMDMMYNYYGTWQLNVGEDIDPATYFKNDALNTAVMYLAIQNEAERLGLNLDAETEAEIAASLTEFSESLGEFYPYWLETMFVTEESLMELEELLYARDLVYDYYFGENGTEVPAAEEFAAAAEDAGWLGGKHILLKTQADDGTQFSAEEKAAVLEQANDLRAQLAAAGDDEALFDQLMNEYSQDVGGLASAPNGYTYGPGTMVSEFEAGNRALDYYEISEPIETSYGYHIIMRFPIDDTIETYREDVLGDMWNTKLDALIAAAEPETSAAWAAFDLTDFDTKRNEVLDEYMTIYEAMNPTEETGEEVADDPNDTSIDHTGHNHE